MLQAQLWTVAAKSLVAETTVVIPQTQPTKQACTVQLVVMSPWWPSSWWTSSLMMRWILMWYCGLEMCLLMTSGTMIRLSSRDIRTQSPSRCFYSSKESPFTQLKETTILEKPTVKTLRNKTPCWLSTLSNGSNGLMQMLRLSMPKLDITVRSWNWVTAQSLTRCEWLLWPPSPVTSGTSTCGAPEMILARNWNGLRICCPKWRRMAR